ncbi:hypothetical protein L915_18014 [Phytophthora nicotianae]|uniref:Uncharacterized protein n=1 Tax=Phytophthora nicotianae TaxID=4792 RepID=W2FZ80_PHYNI|nr:hypothetical protein L915_18014 [Phytophthora nicotianae]
MELVAKLNYPSSGYKLKAITGFKIYIYHRNHALGDSAVVITKVIRDNQHVTNFPKTNHKCIFHCIAWHSLRDDNDPKALLTDMFKYIESVSLKIQRFNADKYEPLLGKVIAAHGLTGMEIPGIKLGKPTPWQMWTARLREVDMVPQ